MSVACLFFRNGADRSDNDAGKSYRSHHKGRRESKRLEGGTSFSDRLAAWRGNALIERTNWNGTDACLSVQLANKIVEDTYGFRAMNIGRKNLDNWDGTSDMGHKRGTFNMKKKLESCDGDGLIGWQLIERTDIDSGMTAFCRLDVDDVHLGQPALRSPRRDLHFHLYSELTKFRRSEYTPDFRRPIPSRCRRRCWASRRWEDFGWSGVARSEMRHSLTLKPDAFVFPGVSVVFGGCFSFSFGFRNVIWRGYLAEWAVSNNQCYNTDSIRP